MPKASGLRSQALAWGYVKDSITSSVIESSGFARRMHNKTPLSYTFVKYQAQWVHIVKIPGSVGAHC